MLSCVFCDIISGRREAAIAHRDDCAIIIMDHNPIAAGHALVIPTLHAKLLTELGEDAGMHLFRLAMRMDRVLRESSIGADAVQLVLSDGPAAGQEVPHVHLHLIPRHRGDHGAVGRRRASLPELERVAMELSATYQRLYATGGP